MISGEEYDDGKNTYCKQGNIAKVIETFYDELMITFSRHLQCNLKMTLIKGFLNPKVRDILYQLNDDQKKEFKAGLQRLLDNEETEPIQYFLKYTVALVKRLYEG